MIPSPLAPPPSSSLPLSSSPLNSSQRSESFAGTPAATATGAPTTTIAIAAPVSTGRETRSQLGRLAFRAARPIPTWASATPAQTRRMSNASSSPCCCAARLVSPRSSASRCSTARKRRAEPADALDDHEIEPAEWMAAHGYLTDAEIAASAERAEEARPRIGTPFRAHRDSRSRYRRAVRLWEALTDALTN